MSNEHERLEGERMRRMGYEKDLCPYDEDEPEKREAWLNGWSKEDFRTRVVAR